MYYAVIIAVIVMDQIIKYMIKTHMSLYEHIPLIGDFFQFTFIYNTGAAFSILENHKWFLIVLPIIMIILLTIYLTLKRKTESPILLTGLSLIIGGGLGNLTDRILSGKVVDYISIGNFPVFNLADICVCVGCGLIILYILFLEKKVTKA